jgi:hypothetical protein
MANPRLCVITTVPPGAHHCRADQVRRLISYPASSSAFTIASACLIATSASTLCPLLLTCSASTGNHGSDRCSLSINRHEDIHNVKAANHSSKHLATDAEA